MRSRDRGDVLGEPRRPGGRHAPPLRRDPGARQHGPRASSHAGRRRELPHRRVANSNGQPAGDVTIRRLPRSPAGRGPGRRSASRHADGQYQLARDAICRRPAAAPRRSAAPRRWRGRACRGHDAAIQLVDPRRGSSRALPSPADALAVAADAVRAVHERDVAGARSAADDVDGAPPGTGGVPRVDAVVAVAA